MPAKKPGRSHTERNENETTHGATHGAEFEAATVARIVAWLRAGGGDPSAIGQVYARQFAAAIERGDLIRIGSALALALVVACGGSVAPTPSPDASGDASDPADAPGDATPDVAADPCVCLPDALYCHGVRRPDAESCSKCGYPCNSTPDAGGE